MSREPFDPAQQGTSETEWQRLLGRVQTWRPRRGPLIVVAPHPDDETLGAGGLICSWIAAGESVTVISVTDGEAADPGRRDLSLVRRKELRDALRTLAPTHIAVRRLGIPDGKVAEHTNRLINALQDSITEDATLIGPYEQDRHPDHEAAGRVCRQIATAAQLPLATYPVWAWHHCKPDAVQSLQWGRFPLGLAARRAKARALRCFTSQLNPAAGSPIVPPHVLNYFARPYEAFVL
jgi:LmbE family N-acetylglucosaminyl deacetylase